MQILLFLLFLWFNLSCIACDSSGGWVPSDMVEVQPPPPPKRPPPMPGEHYAQYSIGSSRIVPFGLMSQDSGWTGQAGFDFDRGLTTVNYLEYELTIRQPTAVNRLYGLLILGYFQPMSVVPCGMHGDLLKDPRIGHMSQECVEASLAIRILAEDDSVVFSIDNVTDSSFSFVMPEAHSYTIPQGNTTLRLHLELRGSAYFDVRDFRLYVDETTLK